MKIEFPFLPAVITSKGFVKVTRMEKRNTLQRKTFQTPIRSNTHITNFTMIENSQHIMDGFYQKSVIL